MKAFASIYLLCALVAAFNFGRFVQENHLHGAGTMAVGYLASAAWPVTLAMGVGVWSVKP